MKCFGVIGLGTIAKRHARNLRKLHHDSLIYAVSASGTNSSKIDCIDDIVSLDYLISCKPEYAIIASPATYHIEVAKKFIHNKIPILIEKPLAANFNDCKEFLKFSKNNTKIDIAVGYCLRFLPSSLAFKKFIESGSLGQIYNINASVGQYLPNWRPNINYKESVSAKMALGGGALLELSHELDYLYWLFGDLQLKHSMLRSSNELNLEVEDIADLVLMSKDDICINLHLDFIQKETQRSCEVIAENGRLIWDLQKNCLYLHNSKGSKCIYTDSNYDKNNMYLDMLKAFEGIKSGVASDLATLDSATQVLKMVDMAKNKNILGAS